MANVCPDIVGNVPMAMARAVSSHSNPVSPPPDIPAVDAAAAAWGDDNTNSDTDPVLASPFYSEEHTSICHRDTGGRFGH